MTEQEIAERLKALPYDVPTDVRPGYVSVMIDRVKDQGITEEQFWEKLQNTDPEGQESFFAAAREAQSSGQSMVLIIVGMIGFGVLTWSFGGC